MPFGPSHAQLCWASRPGEPGIVSKTLQAASWRRKKLNSDVHSINQSTDQPTNQPIAQPTNQSINRLTNQSINGKWVRWISFNQSIKQAAVQSSVEFLVLISLWAGKVLGICGDLHKLPCLICESVGFCIFEGRNNHGGAGWIGVRVHYRTHGISVSTVIQRIPQIHLHIREQCGLSRHTGFEAVAERRHFEHWRYGGYWPGYFVGKRRGLEVDWLLDSFIHFVIHLSIDWLIDRLNDTLMARLIDWLIDRQLCNILQVYFGGYHGDCSATYAVGDAVDDDAHHLITTTQYALSEAIKICRNGTKISAIGEVIE